MQGHAEFQNHWLYWTDWKVFSSEANSGAYILDSALYLRVLICAFIARTITAFKRTVFGIGIGRHQYCIFARRFERILFDIVLLVEIAGLATEADNICEESGGEDLQLAKKDRGGRVGLMWSTSKTKGSPRGRTLDDDDDDNDSEDSDEAGQGRPSLTRDASGTLKIIDFLDQWKEPDNIKGEEVHIADVMRFRWVLLHMREEFPFGQDFGLASSREDCISSANAVYHNLVKLSSTDGVLEMQHLVRRILSVLVQ